MDSASNGDTKVQHVNKKSSDELLRKFAQTEDNEEAGVAQKKLSKRRRKSRGSSGKENDEKNYSYYYNCESPLNSNGHSNGSSLVERRSLLGPPRKSALLRQLGIHSRAQLKAREIRHKSLFGTIEKTWRRTIDGASKVFVQKHYYNRHKRLINDVV